VPVGIPNLKQIIVWKYLILNMLKNDPNSDQVIHGNQFFLVDKDGTIVKMYNGFAENIEDVPIDTIASDIETYVDENL